MSTVSTNIKRKKNYIIATFSIMSNQKNNEKYDENPIYHNIKIGNNIPLS